MASWLPTSIQEGKEYYSSFTQFDVVFVTGDPYYDHPLSGMAIIARLLDKEGYKVGIVAQPQTDQEFEACGQPKYFFCITSGLLDSMLANYTPMLRKRENVLVPERALITYTQKIKTLFKDSMTVLGGVEATIRRFTHFDYKDNALRRGILHDTKADVLLFGNAERAILTLLERMRKNIPSGESFAKIRDTLDLFSIDGASFRVKKNECQADIRVLPSFEQCVQNKEDFSLLTRIHYLLPDSPFLEPTGAGIILHNRPEHTLTQEESDTIYKLPFTRDVHPNAKNREFVVQMVEKLATSVIIGRGCWGSCNFCVIPLVQGKEVAKRSKESIVREIESLYAKGATKINDLTLPTLNMYGSYCDLYKHPEEIYSPIVKRTITVYNKKDYCNQQCVGCSHRKVSDDLIPILEAVEKLNAKYANTSMELRSALRHDIILGQKKLFRKIMQFTTRLKIAPEHISDKVLSSMNKATRKEFELFLEEFKNVNREQGTRKRLVPYFVAAHPGSTQEDMEELKKFCEDKRLFVNLTQVFTPTPGTASTATYYSGVETRDKKKVYVPRAFREKKDQKNILMSKEEYDASDESG